MRVASAALLLAACGASPSPSPSPSRSPSRSPSPSWPIPAGWKSETISFPLDFAPTLAHHGVEELRFAPGMFDPNAPGYFAYAFAWRLDDAAELTAEQLGAELTTYFRGLLTAVDGDKDRVTDPTVIAFGAATHDDLLVLQGTILDTFNDARLVRMFGFAHRDACPGGAALWTVSLAPDDSPMLDAVREVAKAATCDQQPLAR